MTKWNYDDLPQHLKDKFDEQENAKKKFLERFPNYSPAAKQTKFASVSTIVDGVKFDSKKEANRYRDLKMLQAGGKIKDLKWQIKFELIPTQTYKGQTLRRVSYYADFSYYDTEKNETIIEDVKGIKTTEYIIKKKMLIYKYPNINFIET